MKCDARKQICQLLLLIVCVMAVSACGQRVPLPHAEEKVQDTQEY